MSLFFFLLVTFSGFAYLFGRARALNFAQQAGGKRPFSSLPIHYGCYLALLYIVPATLIFLLWQVIGPSLLLDAAMDTLPESLLNQSPSEILFLRESLYQFACGGVIPQRPDPVLMKVAQQLCVWLERGCLLAGGGALVAGFICAFLGWKAITVDFPVRRILERSTYVLFVACSGFVVVISLAIIGAIFFQAARFFQAIPILDFLFGTHWNPQTAIRLDQIASSGSFGVLPVLLGTLLVVAVAMIVAIPLGLFSAIYLEEYANVKLAEILTPLLEILASIPTVVYGFFAFFFVAPMLDKLGVALGIGIAAESALAAGLVVGFMIVPYISSLSAEVIRAVPENLRETSLVLGATRYETLRHVVFPAALPGVVASILLAFSRAIGETMIVLMVGGFAANFTTNPLDSVSTVTVQIVRLLIGEHGFDSSKTFAAFALGLLLFLGTLIINLIALHVVRGYRQEYE